MPTLNGTQLTALQAELTGNDVAGFYALLESYGDPYGRLGGGVTNNDTWQGALANGFAASAAGDDSVDLSHGSTDWENLNTALAQGYLDAYDDNSGVTPDWEDVQTLHNAAYALAGLDEDDWFVNKLLNDSGDPAALWADFVTNTGPVDLWDDAFDVAGAGAGLVIPPAFAVDLLVDSDFMSKMQFAKNFYEALGGMESAALEDMIGDFTGNGAVTDLLEFIIDLPAKAGALLNSLPDLGDISLKALPGWVSDVTTPFHNAETTSSPIVLDIDASGTIELVALNAAGSVYWEGTDGDDFREASGWITGGDGLLCAPGANGIVDGQSELFGNDATYANGYLKLDALYDSNNSNTITSADTNFGDLRIWVDSNADGYSQSTELHTLSSLGITSLSTGYSNVSYTIAGNEIKQESTFTMNGNSYQSVDAWFTYDNVNSEYAEDYTLDVRTLFLPTLRGYGTLPDLHIAMSLDETLLDMVQELAVRPLDEILAPDFNLEAQLFGILFRWAGVDGVSPGGRGAYTDGRVLGFLEAFMDEPFIQTGNNNGTNPAWGAGADRLIADAWQNAFEALFPRFLLQTAMAEIFSTAPVYNPVTDAISGSFALDLSAIEDIVSPYSGQHAQLGATWVRIFNFLDKTVGIGNLSGGDEADLADLVTDYAGSTGLTFAILENIISSNLSATFNGTSSGEVMFGTITHDSIYGFAANDILITGLGNDYLIAGNGNDYLDGGEGNDGLYGGAGSDVFVFRPGDSSDTNPDNVVEYASEGTDTIQLFDVASGDVHMYGNSSGSLYIEYSATDKILVSGGGIDSTNGETRVHDYLEKIIFANGTNWTLSAGMTLNDTDAAHHFYGTSAADTMNGNGGADILYGGRGNDVINGGAGDDTLYGGAGNDTLTGNSGFEAQRGEGGNDVYVFSSGDSVTGTNRDQVIETTSNGTDKIVFAAGIDPEDVRMWTTTAGDLYIRYSATDEIRVTGGSSGGASLVYNYLESIEFDDSTVWDLTQGLHMIGLTTSTTFYGTALNDYIEARSGSGEYIYGYGGNDTLRGCSGHDVIYGGGGNDVLYGDGGTGWLFGEGGADVFGYEAATAYSAVNTVQDFNTGQNDALDLSDLLGQYDPLTEAITDFVQITTSGSSSSVFVDRDGTSGGYGFNQIASIYGVTGLTDEAALVSSGHLIVV